MELRDEFDRIESDIVLALEDELEKAGWPAERNRAVLCSVCFDHRSPGIISPVRQHGMVYINKLTNSGELFCACHTCGTQWKEIEHVLEHRGNHC